MFFYLFIYLFCLFFYLKKQALLPEDDLIDNLILLNLFRFRVHLCNFKYTRFALKLT